MNPQDMRDILKLYLVAGTQDCRHLPDTPQQNLLGVLEQALQSGISCYQFREKGNGSLQDFSEIKELARACQQLCRRYNVPFVLNNDVELAVEMGADGVHIGQKDMPLAQAAELCGGKLFIGISNNSFDNILASLQIDKADYFACGPVFPTQSKPDAAAPVGVELVQRVRESGIVKPLVAIGGIKAEHAAAIRAAGADGIAVISAITRAPDVAAAVKALLP